ncbi:hypothetical protein QTP88_012884 [Uroleucon formosanum]
MEKDMTYGNLKILIVEIETNGFQKVVEEIKEQFLRKKTQKTNNTEYRRIQNKIKRKKREAKEKEKEEQCAKIELHQRNYDDFNVYRKVKEVTDRFRKKNYGKLVDSDGKIIVNIDEKKHIWKTYLENLFYDVREEQEPKIRDRTGPDILLDEVKSAIKQLKEGKASGPDQIHSEFIRLLDDEKIKWITVIINSVYKSGIIPEDWMKSEFIVLPKKSSAKTCGDYRMISLMNHLLKLFLKIIHKRIYRKCEGQIASNQFGFLNAVGTREALFSAQILFQRCRDVNCSVFACLIDYQKAFDRIRHDIMIRILEEIGIDGKDLRIIANLYWNQTAVLKMEDKTTDPIKIRRGVRQGCILSSILFNFYSEYIFREALNEIEEGISINGTRLNNLSYADDAIVFADSIEGLQLLMDRITEASMRYGLDINTNKTKFMIISKEDITGVHLSINQSRIERVHKYQYLGTVINDQWDNAEEIKCRIGKARSVFNLMNASFKSHNLSIQLKIRLLRCYMFSTLLYGAETWTLTKATSNKLEVFELWLYRRILRISWTEKITNVEVLRRMGKKKELMITVKCRKLQYLGHIMRNKNRYELLQCILQRRKDSKRSPGRRRTSWLAK